MSDQGGNFGFGFVPTSYGQQSQGFFEPNAPSSFGATSSQSFGPSGNDGDEDYENEPPLLEELGMFHHDSQRIRSSFYLLTKNQGSFVVFLIIVAIGINFGHIKQKTVAVLNPLKRDLDAEQLDDADLAGPFVFALLLGATLLLRGSFPLRLFSYCFFYVKSLFSVGCRAVTTVVSCPLT
jgi:hypothetical protein